MVFDTLHKKVIGRIPAPQVAGVIDATDLHKIFAADAEDNLIYDINVNTLQIEGQIQLPDNDGPDAIGYDPVDHRVFVSDPGSPVDPLQSGNVDRKNQNVAVIDAIHDKLLGLVSFGFLPLFGGEKASITTGNIQRTGMMWDIMTTISGTNTSPPRFCPMQMIRILTSCHHHIQQSLSLLTL